MSSRLLQNTPSLIKHPLKRTQTEHKNMRRDLFALKNPFQSSRSEDIASKSRFNHNKASFETQAEPKVKEFSLQSNLTQSTQSSLVPNNESIDKIQAKMNEVIKANSNSSMHCKEKKSYSNRYEEKQVSDYIWVSQPKWIPQQISKEYDACERSMRPGEKVNFYQGFLSEIGFMYYGVEKKVFFYDIETMNQGSTCLEIIQTEDKLIDAFYGIQVMKIGPPYLSTPRNVLVFFHFQQAELYHYSLNKNLKNNERVLEIKSLNISFLLQRTRPSKLVMDNRGVLFYTDHKGSLKSVNYDQSIVNRTVSQITSVSKRLVKNVQQFWQNTSKNISKNVISFYNTVCNFGRSLFAKKALQSEIIYDPIRNLIITYYSELMSDQKYRQQLKIYSPEDQKLLYTLSEKDFLDNNSKNDVIIKFKIIDKDLNNDYNLVLLLNSGKRIFLDITEELLRKSVTYQVHPTSQIKYFGESSQNSFTVESCLLEQNFFSTLLYSSSSFCCSYVRDQIYEKHEIVYKMEVEVHGGPKNSQYYMFSRDLQQLGPVKDFLLAEQSQNCKIKNMCLEVRGVFFRPQQIVHATDQMVQRIVILRSVDIVFSLLSQLENIPQTIRGIQMALGSAKTQDLISLCCQILLDQEGTYFISHKLAQNIKKKLVIRVEDYQRYSQNKLQQISYQDIPKETKYRLEQFLIDLSKKDGNDKEIQFVNGLIDYLAKLMRPLWLTNINNLSSEVCKAMLTILQSVEQFLSKFKKRMSIINDGMFSFTLSWVKRVWELFFLIKTIPTLPDTCLQSVIVSDPKDLHEYLFNYLIKYSQQKQVKDFQRSTPVYATQEFVQNFNFWLTLKEIKSIQQKISFCKQRTMLPEYILKHLSSIRGLQEVRIFFQSKRLSPAEVQKHFDAIGSYKDILRCLSETLVQKEILIQRAKVKLNQESKKDENYLAIGQAQIAEVQSRIHLQSLIRDYYVQNRKQSQSWTEKISKMVKVYPSSSPQTKLTAQDQIITIFDMHLFDREALNDLIESTQDPLIDIAYANHYVPDQLREKIMELITTTIKEFSDSRNLLPLFKHQIKYLLTRVKVGLEKEVLIKFYIEKMSQIPEIIDSLRQEEGILEEEFYFPLVCLAQITGDIEQIYKWAKKTLNQLDKTSDYFIFLSACITYFIKYYAPQKKEEFCSILQKVHSKENLFKKMAALLLE